MAKVKLCKFKIKIKSAIKCNLDFNGQVDVIQYLPIEDKYDLVMDYITKV